MHTQLLMTNIFYFVTHSIYYKDACCELIHANFSVFLFITMDCRTQFLKNGGRLIPVLTKVIVVSALKKKTDVLKDSKIARSNYYVEMLKFIFFFSSIMPFPRKGRV